MSNNNITNKSTYSQISSLENILEKTKTEIYKKLNDLKAAVIKVQLEVEYNNPVDFEVKKASDGTPVEFQPVEHPNNRHIIYFNYDRIVDFIIGVKNRVTVTNNASNLIVNDANSDEDEDTDVVNAQIDGK